MTVTNFPISTGNDDGYRNCNKTSYPPASTDNPYGSPTGTTLYVERSFNTPNYDITTVHLRFDTSAIPNDATVTAANLKLYVDGGTSADGLNLCGEWHLSAAPPASTDWTADAATTAFSVALNSLTDAALNTIALTDPAANVNKSGYTGIRLTVSKRAADAAPTGGNGFTGPSLEHATNPEPTLEVTYTEAGGGIVKAGLGVLGRL
jgi:hypothetical protein